MAKKLYEESNISAIAESIRAKTGTDTKYKTSEMPSGVNEVYESGRQDVISKSKYIEKTASGKGVFLNNVSEVAHKVKVYADTPTEVKVYGKNLFNNDTSLLKEVSPINSSGAQFTRIGYEPYILPAGTYTFTITDLNTSLDKYIYGVINDKDGNFVRGCSLLAGKDIKTPLTITVNEADRVYIYNGISSLSLPARAAEFEATQIQLEVGSIATSDEPYKEPQTITATPNGAEADSLCPNMNFLTDSEITVDYYGSYGMQTEYDRFWDDYQENGKRTNYSYAFAHTGWTDRTFKPKYDIALSGGAQMFYYSRITDLVGILEKQGVVINTSNASSVTYMYGYSVLTRIPLTDLSSATNTTYLYAGDTALISIEKIISSEKTVFANNSFNNCKALEHCIFEGTIASDINLQWSTKLDLESLGSLFRCLKNYLADDPDNAHTKTVTLSAESWALLDTYVYENGWNDYNGAKDVVSTCLGWNYA